MKSKKHDVAGMSNLDRAKAIRDTLLDARRELFHLYRDEMTGENENELLNALDLVSEAARLIGSAINDTNNMERNL